jgi:hypothetical protein
MASDEYEASPKELNRDFDTELDQPEEVPEEEELPPFRLGEYITPLCY